MNKVFIIAEAGVNHNGDIDIAKKLVDVAVEAEADAIKFQTFKAEELVCKNAKKAEYQKEHTEKNESQLEMLKKLELDINMHDTLMNYCKDKGILFLSTPFDLRSIDLLEKLNIPIYKIPSGEITNYPYLKKIAGLKKKIIMSTGMSYLSEVKDAINVLKENGAEDITVLHCNTEYPTLIEDVNLNAMITMKKELNVNVGYSDHTVGIDVPIAAVAMGATVIEKHFTIDKDMEGPDHKASLNPQELKMMVKSIRNIEKALGSCEKVPSNSEIKNLVVARKSIVAKCEIKKGTRFTEENLACKRPGNGISPMRWSEIIGTRAVRDFSEDELIEI